MGGLAGWAFLKRTQAAQQAAFAASPAVKRETTQFAERIAQVRTAEDLVADRALLKVALGAFGLGADLDSRHFVKRILEEGTTERGALANKLTDKRYGEMARAFGFDRTGSGVLDRILSHHPPRTPEDIAMEHAGHSDQRLGAVLRRELAAIATLTATQLVESGAFDADGKPILEEAERPLTEDQRWSAILDAPGLREAFEVALGLPVPLTALPKDERVGAIRAAAEAAFGDDAASRFADPAAADALTQKVLSRLGPPTTQTGFAQRIVAAYEARVFEETVGEQDPAMRLALNLERELPKIAGRASSEDTRWFTIMGTPPLRQVFETAFGLPKSFGTLDVDQQLGILKDKAQQAFGDATVAQFAEPGTREALTRLYLARAQLAQGFGSDTSPASTALTLLSNVVR